MPLLEEYANAATLLEQQHMPQIPLPTNLEQAGAHLRNEYAALAEQLRETGQHALLDALPPESHLFRAAGDDGAVLDDDGAAAFLELEKKTNPALNTRLPNNPKPHPLIAHHKCTFERYPTCHCDSPGNVAESAECAVTLKTAPVGATDPPPSPPPPNPPPDDAASVSKPDPDPPVTGIPINAGMPGSIPGQTSATATATSTSTATATSTSTSPGDGNTGTATDGGSGTSDVPAPPPPAAGPLSGLLPTDDELKAQFPPDGKLPDDLQGALDGLKAAMEEAGQTPGALPQMTTVGDVRKLLGATAEGLAAEYAAKLVKAKVAEDVSSQQYAAGKDAPQLFEQLRDAHAEMLPAELLASQNPGLRPGRPVAAEAPAAAGTGGGGGASEEPQLLQTSQGSYTEEGSGTCDTSKPTCRCERRGYCHRPTPTPRVCRADGAGGTAPDCWDYDQCPPTLHPRTEEAFCSMFAVMWWNGIQVCTTNLERWKENSQRNWVLERSLPSFIDVWYHGFGANPVDGESPPRNNRVNIAEGQGVLRGNPVSIVMNKAMVFMTQSRDTGVLHRTFRSQKHPAWTGIGGWGWETIQSLAGFFTIYVSVEHPLYESEWVHWSMASGSYNSQLVFTHDIGSVPARVGVFFSAQCSDNDPYISVARYSWGVFNPKQIEVNKKQVVLHMSQELHAGGFWIPNSWADGRYYRYGAGCFKVTCGSTGEFDSGWFDAHDNKGGANWIASNQDSNDRKWFGYSHQFDGIPKSVQVFFSPQPVSGGELEPDDEAYPLLHGYNFFTSGNPMTVWADHIGIHLEFWGVFHDHGAWRGSCAHLDAALAGKASLAKAKQQCSAGGWRFHRSGSWRILGWGCAKLKDHFPPWQPRTFFGDPDIDE